MKPEEDIATTPLYLHATLTPKPGGLTELGDTVAWLRPGMERRGMTMVRAFRTVGDEPGRMVDLWQVPAADTVVDALTGAKRHPGHGRAMERLSRWLDDEVLRVLAPAAHCPGFDDIGGADTWYAQVVHRVEYGRGSSAWERLAPAGAEFAAARNWRLVAAFDTLIGDLCELYEIWRAPEGLPVGAVPHEPAMGPDALHGLVRSRTVTALVPLPWSV